MLVTLFRFHRKLDNTMSFIVRLLLIINLDKKGVVFFG